MVKMIAENRFADDDIQTRFEAFYGDSREFAEGQIPYWRDKLSSLSEFVREIKVKDKTLLFRCLARGKLQIVYRLQFPTSLSELRRDKAGQYIETRVNRQQ